jgi:hypothetical protein
MGRRPLVATGALLVGIGSLGQGQAPVRPSGDPALIAAAREVVTLLEKHEFRRVSERFDARMLEVLPAPKLEEFWTGLVAQVGKLVRVDDGAVMSQGGLRTVVFPLGFERAELVISITYNATGEVAGMYVNPKG